MLYVMGSSNRFKPRDIQFRLFTRVQASLASWVFGLFYPTTDTVTARIAQATALVSEYRPIHHIPFAFNISGLGVLLFERCGKVSP